MANPVEVQPEYLVQLEREAFNASQFFTGKKFTGPIRSSRPLSSFKYFDLGIKQVLVREGDNIQDAINLLEIGGGKIVLQGASHFPGAIIGKTALTFEGEHASTSIIDFGNASKGLSFAGTNVYTTGTITGVSGVTVTGSGTSWLANADTTKQMFIAGIWYKIAAVVSDTSIILAEGFQGGATFPGASYRIANVKQDINFKELTFQNSGITLITFTDCRNIIFDNVFAIGGNKAFVFNNCSEIVFTYTNVPVNDDNGIEFNSGGLINWNGLVTAGNGGIGIKIVDCQKVSGFASASDANTGTGITIQDSADINIQTSASGNGGHGIECISGNSNINLNGVKAHDNTSSGIKLTATSDDVTIGAAGSFEGNGAYGVDNAAATNDNALILGNNFKNNTSGDINDEGTNTVIQANTPLSLNDAVGFSKDTTAGEAITGATLPVPVLIGDGNDGVNFDITANGTDITFGELSVDQKVAQSIQETSDVVVEKINVRLHTSGSPSDSVKISLQTDNSGEPSGTILESGDASATIAAGSLTGSTTQYTLTLTASTILAANTKYWLVWERTGSLNDTDKYVTRASGSNPYANGAQFNFTGSWAENSGQDLDVDFLITLSASKVYQSDANNSSRDDFMGFVTTTSTADGNPLTIKIVGVIEGFSGLTPQATYYVQDAIGTIGTSPGSTTIQVGVALSATELLIRT